MLFWIIQVSIMSIIIVFLVDNIMSFFKSTLTVTKTKNINYNDNPVLPIPIPMPIPKTQQNNTSYTEIDLLPIYTDEEQEIDRQEINAQGTEEEEDTDAMKDELRNFLKNQVI